MSFPWGCRGWGRQLSCWPPLLRAASTQQSSKQDLGSSFLPWRGHIPASREGTPWGTAAGLGGIHHGQWNTVVEHPGFES